MGEPAKVSLPLRAFGGMNTHTNAEDLEPGTAEEQLNITSDRVSDLSTRGGYRLVRFEDS